MKKKIFGVLILLSQGAMVFGATPGGAGAGGGMPWDTSLQRILDALTGSTLRIISMVLIVVAGVVIATSEGQGIKKKAAWIVIGLAVATNAASLVATLFGLSGALI